MVLICKEKKTGADYTELDALRRQVEIRAKVRRYEAPGGHSGDLNDKVANRNAGERKKTKKNHFTADQAAELKAIFLDQLHGYQEAWLAALTFPHADDPPIVADRRRGGRLRSTEGPRAQVSHPI